MIYYHYEYKVIVFVFISGKNIIKIEWKNIDNKDITIINSWLSNQDKHNLCMTQKGWKQTAEDIADCLKYMDKADVMLTELKAAAVDVATKDAIAAGLDVVYCDNIPVPINDSFQDLSDSIIKLVDSAIDNFNKKSE